MVGYRVYYGTASRAYTQVRDAGNATTITISNLLEGTTYYFAATAYDGWGLESDYSAETSYTVPVPVLNYTPTLDSIAAITIPEGSGSRAVNLTGISSGSASEAQTLVVTATSSNPSLIPAPAVSYTSPNSTGTLTINPVPYLYGSATITVTVNDGGSTNNTVSKSFVVTVPSVNNAPTLASIADIAVAEDSAQFAVSLTGISSGATNESQTLTVTASSSNTGLIPAPTVTYTSPSATGSLTLRPVATKFGSATITVNVNDNASSNNIVTRTFLVTVTPVNDAPTINTLANINLARGASAQTVALSGIGSGATNETQTLAVTAVSSNPALIPNPSVTYTTPASTGSLTFTPSSGIGSAVITVTVDDGGAENNTKSVSFTVVLNDPPSISDIAHRAIALGSNMPPVAFTVSDSETAASSLTVTATSSNTQLVPNANIILGGSGTNRTIAINPFSGRTGTATITVTVSDGVSTATDSFQLAVQQRPAPPGNFHLVIQGLGQVTPSMTGGLIVGQTYTLTAVPDAEQEFAGWSGSVESSSPTISFVAGTNTDLVATFVPSPFIPTKGIYTGLFYETNEVRQVSSGCFAFQSSARGKYSGYVQIGVKRYSFSGKFDLNCLASNTITRLGSSPLKLLLAMDTNGTDMVTGEVSDGSWTAPLLGDRATFHSLTNRAPWTGAYTMVLPGQDSDPLLPFGHSFGVVKVSASGSTILTGKLADGTPFTRTVRMSKAGMLPVYMPLYLGAGSVVSWTGMEERTTDDLHGDAHWIRPPIAAASAYAAGFSFASTTIGARYTAPTAGTPLVSLASSVVKFLTVDGEFENAIQVSPAGLVKNLGTNRMVMSMVPGAGTFKGSVINPYTGKTLPFGGALLQKQNAGYGFIKTGATVGRVTIL